MPPPFFAPPEHYDDSIARCDSASFREKAVCGQGRSGHKLMEI
jgi:hypothetical protein